MEQIWKEYGPKRPTDSFAMFITFIGLPCGFLHGVFYVVPSLYPLDDRYSAEEISDNYWKRIVHTISMIYLMSLICTDLYLVLTTNTSCQALTIPDVPQSGWSHCPYCKQSAPPRTHHCLTCQKCILRRDHHCYFIGKCVGYYNHKYFMLFLLHTLIASTYGVILSIYLVSQISGGFSLSLLAAAILPVLVWMLQLVDVNPYVIFATAAAIFFMFLAGSLLLIHGFHLYKGQTYWEAQQGIKREEGVVNNLRDIMGRRWWIVWLCTFIPSSLENDGTHYLAYKETRKVQNTKQNINKGSGSRKMVKST